MCVALFVVVGTDSVCGCCSQVKRTSLVDSRTAVNDVKFAPRHLGLQLVSVGPESVHYFLCVYIFARHHAPLMVN